MKYCGKCERRLDDSAFQKNRSRPSGLQTQCRECMNARKTSWEAKHPELKSANRKKHYDSPKASALVKAWRERNPERVIENNATWRAANPAKVRQFARARKALKRRAVSAWIDQRAVDEFYFAADFLGMVTGDWYHVDHIVPLASPLVCGLHNQFNLQVLTARENMVKGNRVWPLMP